MLIALATAVALAGVAGLALAPLLARNRALHAAGLAFATGTLLSMTLLHVMPEATEMAAHSGTLFVVGFVLMMLAHQHGLDADPCCGHEHARHAGLPSLLALSICSLNDGLVLSSDVGRGFLSPLLWAMCVHKAMAAFALLLLLREVGAIHDRRRTIAYLAGYLAVTPLALLLATELSSARAVWGSGLAVAAGALLYVIAGSLVPRVEHLARERLGPVLLVFVGAVCLNVGVELLAPHDHQPTPVTAPG